MPQNVQTDAHYIEFDTDRKIRHRNKLYYRFNHWPIWIFVFFIAPGPLTFDLFEKGVDQRMLLWLGAVLLVTGTAGLFGRLVLAVAAGHHKRTMFTLDERLDMARELTRSYGNVEVVAFEGLLRDFVVNHGGKVVVRGLRAVSDFEYEFQMAGMNRQLMPEVETVFLTPSDQYQFVSGTFVREIATLGGDVSKFVAPTVLERLRARVARPAA